MLCFRWWGLTVFKRALGAPALIQLELLIPSWLPKQELTGSGNWKVQAEASGASLRHSSVRIHMSLDLFLYQHLCTLLPLLWVQYQIHFPLVGVRRPYQLQPYIQVPQKRGRRRNRHLWSSQHLTSTCPWNSVSQNWKCWCQCFVVNNTHCNDFVIILIEKERWLFKKRFYLFFDFSEHVVLLFKDHFWP